MKDVLFYYGWLNAFNSAVNGWDNEKVAQDLARYDIIVLGDGLQNSGHGDYANTVDIIGRLQALRPDTSIFGYVSSNQSESSFVSKVRDWDDLCVDGIFMDESGYDFSVSRPTLNGLIDIVHGLSCATRCFVNAWNPNHVMGIEEDASYPNSTYNPNEVESNLNEEDLYLMESLAVNTLAYTASDPDGYEPMAQMKSRIETMQALRDLYDIKVIGVAVIDENNANAQDFFDFAQSAAKMANLDGFGSSDHYYGASSAKATRWTRNEIRTYGKCDMAPALVVDANDSDVLLALSPRGSIVLDFSDNAQSSTTTRY